MTRPHEGDAFIGVHADTSPYEKEADRGIRKASEHLDDTTAKSVGKDLGDAVSKSAGDELEKSGPELVKRVEKGLAGKRVRWKVKTIVDKDNNVVRRVVEETFQEIEQAFNSASRPGGLFSRLSSGVADAVGAGFNVSGKSPLIALLVPLVGTIVGLVLAAIQAVNALLPVVASIPALIFAIGLQVGVVAIAFNGLGDAIQGAFAAKNAKELNEAIKNLTPSAQKFVKELLPLKQLFADIGKSVQESFFGSLGSIIPQLQATLGPVLQGGFVDLASAMGGLFRDLALFFSSPGFVNFVKVLFPATIDFLKRFGPSFLTFLTGLIDLSTAILPFLSTLGMMLSGTLTQIGEFFTRLSKDPGFPDFLKSMQKTLELVLELVGGVVEFFAVLFAQLDAAGGKEVLQALIDAVEQLTFFLSTDVGKKALEGLIHLSILSIQLFTGVVLGILAITAAIEVLAEWITNTFVPVVIEIFGFMGDTIVDLFGFLGTHILAFFNMVGGAILDFWNALKRFFTWKGSPVQIFVDTMIAEVRNLSARILGAVAGFPTLLFNAGANLINGLINGIRSKFGFLGSIMNFASQIIRDHWPFSPAKTGPLSGSGDPMIAGQKTMQRFAEGIRMEIPELRSVSNDAVSNIMFGRDAVRVTFEGALPTQDQAMATGSAVGAGITGRLAARNTRLAVRTL